MGDCIGGFIFFGLGIIVVPTGELVGEVLGMLLADRFDLLFHRLLVALQALLILVLAKHAMHPRHGLHAFLRRFGHILHRRIEQGIANPWRRAEGVLTEQNLHYRILRSNMHRLFLHIADVLLMASCH